MSQSKNNHHAIKITEKALRLALPAPEIQHTPEGLYITIRVHDESGTKGIALRGKADREHEMLSYLDKHAEFLRPNNELRLTEDENNVIKENIDYVKERVDGKTYDSVRTFFVKGAMLYALIRYGNIEHEIYLHSTQEELDRIVQSFLDQEYIHPLNIAHEEIPGEEHGTQ